MQCGNFTSGLISRRKNEKSAHYVPEFTRGHEECFKSTKYGCEDGKELSVKVPECWRLVIDNVTATNICVPKDVWEKTQVGQEGLTKLTMFRSKK